LTYKAALTKNFIRELKKLHPNLKDRTLKAINEITANPFSGVKLRGELEGRYRFRIGKYRIIYTINQTTQLIILLDVGPRKTIYNK